MISPCCCATEKACARVSVNCTCGPNYCAPSSYSITVTHNGSTVATFSNAGGCFTLESGSYVVSISAPNEPTITWSTNSYSFTYPGTVPSLSFSGTYCCFPSCYCACNMPDCWTLTSSNETCSCGLFQSTTLNWEDPGPGGAFGAWWSGELEFDCGDGDAACESSSGPFYYALVCNGGILSLSIQQSGDVEPNSPIVEWSFECTSEGPILGSPSYLGIEYPAGNFPCPGVPWCGGFGTGGGYVFTPFGVTLSPGCGYDMGMLGLADQVGERAHKSTPKLVKGRIRVGLFFPCLNYGGAESHQFSMIQSVNKDKVVWMGAVGVEGSQYCEPSVAKTLSEYLPVGYGIQAAKTLALECDVILTWAAVDYEPILAGLPLQPKIVYINHFETHWDNILTKLLKPYVDKVVAVSELASRVIPKGFDKETIWNCVEESKLKITRSREEIRDLWGLPEGALVAGYVGRYAMEHKGIAKLPEIARALPQPWHVVTVGKGNDGDRFREMCKGLSNIHVMDEDNLTGDVMNSFDLLLVPSRYESFGLVIAEASRMRLPVLSTPVGIAKLIPGLTRIVDHDADGWEWRDAILADWEDEIGRSQRVERSHVTSHVRLSAQRFGKEWTELLTSVTKDRSRPLVVPRRKSCNCGGKKKLTKED